ncbi:MAG: methyltransferase domain-containing protein [Dechloromonas sp.]|uniref:Methyltransferase domain-containing protein n=1 Tax=Candidatus Dechloromonas phosphorivorans TaxID=2899244 RepID=A0A935JU16_9RHOO|nr:methyltransferase domain-containing protein [Candidatus Dechloromonas phosphorivorans]
MDFRDKALDDNKIDEAKKFIIEGLISYQPFVFSDNLEVGVGFEFEQQRYAGLVHYPDIPEHLRASPELARRLLADRNRTEFHLANRRLADFYDSLVEQIIDHTAGGIDNNSFLDVGCNNGYIPISFSQRGAKRATGCDRQDFSRVFNFLNSIQGTNAEFIHAWYEPQQHRIAGVEAFDVVTSMAMLCHVSDPLHLLAELGRLSKNALFVWTLFNHDDSNVVRYGTPRGDYPGDVFPYCFDNLTAISVPLFHKSMELMGFSKIIELPVPQIHSYAWNGYPFRGFLAIRNP